MAITYIVRARRFFRGESEIGLFAVVAQNDLGDFSNVISEAKNVAAGTLEQTASSYSWTVENVMVTGELPVSNVIYHRVTEE